MASSYVGGALLSYFDANGAVFALEIEGPEIGDAGVLPGCTLVIFGLRLCEATVAARTSSGGGIIPEYTSTGSVKGMD